MNELDLGLGNGLKPGSISFELYSSILNHASNSDICGLAPEPDILKSHPNSRLAPALIRLRESCSTEDSLPKSNSFHNILKLENVIGDKNKPCCHLVSDFTSKNVLSEEGMNIIKALHSDLHLAVTDKISLKHELETFRQLFESKCQAVKILKRQVDALRSESQEFSTKLNDILSERNETIRKLQFDLEYSQNILIDSQQTWSSRFDRVCEENRTLKSEMNDVWSRLRHTSAELLVLRHEKEELLALIEITERRKWEGSCGRFSDSRLHLNESTSAGSTSNRELTGLASVDGHCEDLACIELAVLGACTCRDSRGQPCPCAREAARARIKSFSLLQSYNKEIQQKEDAYKVVEAYRNSFEEQLKRNRLLISRLTELTRQNMQLSQRKMRIFSRKNASQDHQYLSSLHSLLDVLVCQLESQDIKSNSRSNSSSRQWEQNELRGSRLCQLNGDSAVLDSEETFFNSRLNSRNSTCSSISSSGERRSEKFSIANWDGDHSRLTGNHRSTSNIDELIFLLCQKLNDHGEDMAHRRISADIKRKKLKQVELLGNPNKQKSSHKRSHSV